MIEVTRDNPEEAWAHVPQHAMDIYAAAWNGYQSWNYKGPEAECPHDHGVLKTAWGRGYNFARYKWPLDYSRLMAEFRHRKELI